MVHVAKRNLIACFDLFEYLLISKTDFTLAMSDRQIRRFERELDRLREKIRELERRLETLKDR